MVFKIGQTQEVGYRVKQIINLTTVKTIVLIIT